MSKYSHDLIQRPQFMLFHLSVSLSFMTKKTFSGEEFIFCDRTPRSALKVDRRFGGTYRLHLHIRKIIQARTQHDAGNKQAWLILRP
jgi:hypothetical protein